MNLEEINANIARLIYIRWCGFDAYEHRKKCLMAFFTVLAFLPALVLKAFYGTRIKVVENGKPYRLFRRKNVAFYLPMLKDGDIIQQVIFYKSDFYENRVLKQIKKYINPGDVVFDIGANIGNHSVYFAKICRAGAVYSFEPVEDTYRQLTRNISINKLDGIVTAFNCGVSDEVGLANIAHYSTSNIGATGLEKCGGDSGIVKLVSIDTFLPDTKVDFVKIDVEGFEEFVLKGMTKTLAASKPVIFIESIGDNFEKIKLMLESNGYELKETHEHSNYLFAHS